MKTLIPEVIEFIDMLNDFNTKAFWMEHNVPPKTHRKIQRQIKRIKKILLKEQLL